MSFWLFMLISCMLIPLMQIGFGLWFIKHPPEKLLFVIGKSEKVTGSVGGIICLCQVVLLLSAVFFTEHALHKEFDKNGKRI